MKRIFLSFLLALVFLPASAQYTPITDENLEIDFSQLKKRKHPRLFITDKDMKGIRREVELGLNPYVAKFHDLIMYQADKGLGNDAIFTVKPKSRNCLDASRKALKQLSSEAYAYRYTGDPKYLDALERDLERVCELAPACDSRGKKGFQGLDRAEITFALGLCYDWLYKDLSQDLKKKIIDAMDAVAFRTKYMPYRYRYHNNWNHVVNGGLSAALIGTYEAHDTLAQRIIRHAIVDNQRGLSTNTVEGACLEGASYWSYATKYEAVFLLALEDNFGTDFGLSKYPGFLESGYYKMFTAGNIGLCYNYADCHLETLASAALWYVAWKAGDPDMLYQEITRNLLSNVSLKKNKYVGDRTLFVGLVSAHRLGYKKAEPSARRQYLAHGDVELLISRTGWDRDDIYLGMKGGSAHCTAHAHMDAGSFVYEQDGVRWATEGPHINYGMKIKELTGKALFSTSQNSARWYVMGASNTSHSCMIIDDKWFDVNASPVVEAIDEPGRLGGRVDLTDLYGGDVRSAVRTIVVRDESYLEITDVLTGGDKDVEVRWNFTTKPGVELTPDGIILKQGGKSMILSTDLPSASYRTWSADARTYDTPIRSIEYDHSKGFAFCGYTFTLPAGDEMKITTTLKRYEK